MKRKAHLLTRISKVQLTDNRREKERERERESERGEREDREKGGERQCKLHQSNVVLLQTVRIIISAGPFRGHQAVKRGQV